MNIVGEIKMFAGDFIPPGFMECDGSILPIPLYKQLFAVIGYTYTEDIGSSGYGKYFQLPSGKGVFPSSKWIICVEGYFPRQKAQQIYSVPTGDLIRDTSFERNKRLISDKYVDPKLKEKIDYDAIYWSNYNADTDEFEEPR